MPKRLRLNRRSAVAMTHDAHRRLHRFSREAGISVDEALTFVFSHFNSITDDTRLARHLGQFKARIEECKA